ncbi:NusG domain II-containing protein [Aerococcaceae bacterium zg-ZUI334]|uniref:NusG domain II-containing protein n=1 Tax=Aerococcaceae TaxID=186827 RepID=UPI0013BDA41F|nr:MULTISPECIES: NusG domain II-containing protein [unclassified Facklamia]MBR7928381.1 NusG domain II-containing protein [Aerococcaceae bacterium zg-ZUI334]MBS4461512.1 NusG domain II-containing protein [Aerococcaceae bacterium zg-B36]QQD65158.1 NusG domain II-containing protein [Aerococcaceae bacterium zg-252]NEW63805.1 NusG domain II-containing protein [Facklamia sp. 252]NEW67276.1 NusG domain II-containing protein [Facklamia sp. 253]
MDKIKHFLKPWDYILIILALFLSFSPNLVTAIQQSTKPKVTAVGIVKIYGVEVDRFELYDGAPNEQKTYHPSEGQYNIIEREGTHIRIKEDNSPDQIGVRTGWIHKPGQVAICLPHGLIIEVQGAMEQDELVLPL